jgi:hypothetical protein
MEPTPIFAALTDRAGPAAHEDGRPVTDLLRRLRAEHEAGAVASHQVGAHRRAHVGDVPGLLTFRLPA